MRTQEEIIRDFLPKEEGCAAELAEAMNYSLLAGGKRIRPTLMLETYRLFGGKGAEIEPLAAALEMIHTYSLVHDDLPAMDNDVLRRGRTTTWKEYGEAQGILAGDALLTYAFETAAKVFEYGCDPKKAGRAIGILANKAGVFGMCGGQSVDVALEGQPIDEATLNYIYENKTGALLQAAMLIGALMGGAEEEDISRCGDIALKIGLAFQIRDDILDITSTEEELGKPIGSDAKNEKYTYAGIHGLKAAQEEVERLSAEALSELEALPGDKSFFRAFIKKLETRSN